MFKQKFMLLASLELAQHFSVVGGFKVTLSDYAEVAKQRLSIDGVSRCPGYVFYTGKVYEQAAMLDLISNTCLKSMATNIWRCDIISHIE